ncbi:uncharacterized protein LOC132053954 [Lycium ferocissimum]|uniref:uncharacterized protein LOC132053954 n=1 Tax=Lycium ferocissimum TaxID=112874 RepID=UPI002816813E|nr:uncharacterized protein LOC132053954 [Lycium ferocissimum]
MAQFNKFSEALGPKANMSNSQVYFGGGVTPEKVNEILDVLGFEKGDLPFRYLRVSLSTKRLTIQQCKPLVEKITARITNWMARELSYAGRLQLIRAVLFGVQAYWSQLFLLPQKVINLIEAACRSYLWSGEAVITKRALVAWERVCLPKGAGGMNVIQLKTWNQAALCKLLWALSQSKQKLWIAWIHTYYIKTQLLENMESPKQASWMVRKIFNMRKYWSQQDIRNQVVQKGKFKITKAYRNLRGTVCQVPWKNLTCYNVAEPKHVFILWVALHSKLGTKDRLIQWGLTMDEKCVFTPGGA